MRPLTKWDIDLLLAFNQASGSWLDPVFAWPTYLGFIAVIVPVVFLFLWIFDRKNLRRRFSFFVIPIVLIDLSVRLLKYVIARPRPYDFLAQEISEGKIHLNLALGPATSNYSFPSGHAALAFASAILLNYLYRGKLLFLYPLAFLMAVSRIYTGVHYPSDVIGGILIGVSGALIAIYVSIRRSGAELAEAKKGKN